MQPAEQETGNRESDIPERHFIGAHMPCPWSSRPTSFNAPPPPSRWKSGAFTVFPSPTVGSRRVPLFIQIKSASETLLEPDATPLLPSTPRSDLDCPAEFSFITRNRRRWRRGRAYMIWNLTTLKPFMASRGETSEARKVSLAPQPSFRVTQI